MKRVATTSFVLAVITFALVPGGVRAQDTPIASGLILPTFAEIQANVFTPSCALGFCHGAAQQAGLDLREGAAYNSIVNVPSVEVPDKMRIEPFDPDNSFLICKLENCSWVVGQQMPLIGGPLDPAVIGVIREWVLSGALEFPNVAVEATSWGRVKSIYR